MLINYDLYENVSKNIYNQSPLTYLYFSMIIV